MSHDRMSNDRMPNDNVFYSFCCSIFPFRATSYVLWLFFSLYGNDFIKFAAFSFVNAGRCSNVIIWAFENYKLIPRFSSFPAKSLNLTAKTNRFITLRQMSKVCYRHVVFAIYTLFELAALPSFLPPPPPLPCNSFATCNLLPCSCFCIYFIFFLSVFCFSCPGRVFPGVGTSDSGFWVIISYMLTRLQAPNFKMFFCRVLQILYWFLL